MERHGLYCPGSAQGQVVGVYERGNETSGCINMGNFLTGWGQVSFSRRVTELVSLVTYKHTLYCVIHESLRLTRGRNETDIRPYNGIPVFLCRASTIGNSKPIVLIKRAAQSGVRSKIKRHSSPSDKPCRHKGGVQVHLYSFFNLGSRWG